MSSALSICNLRKTYSTGIEALKGIDLEVAAGDFFALLGPNGAGKTTTIGIICSLVRKSAGSVSIFGHDIVADPVRARSNLGVMPQEFNCNSFERIENILINQAGYYGIPRRRARPVCEQMLRQLGLWEMRHMPAVQLSGGMKRRLLVARALVHKPSLLILDEPTAGVDISLRRSLWDFLRQINRSGTTIILTTHYLEEAEMLCRNIAIIDQGKIVQNSSMQDLLRLASRQTFLLDSREKLPSSLQIDSYESEILDNRTLRVSIPRQSSLNQLFEQLQNKKIDIVSMRPETSRLETLFLSLTKTNSEESSRTDSSGEAVENSGDNNTAARRNPHV